MIFKSGDLVKIVDNTGYRSYRPGVVLKSFINKCRIYMLDCNDIADIEVHKIKKGEIK